MLFGPIYMSCPEWQVWRERGNTLAVATGKGGGEKGSDYEFVQGFPLG